ncbi:hypothetical protein LJB93_03200 [Desulfovibrio sp. OttesenSCG-928-F07]|nr:hypothetical protein [Desulfovibrio sp. OttesenSCG-928-F07]
MAVSSISAYNTQMSLTDYMLKDNTQKTEEESSASSNLSVAQRNNVFKSYGANANTGIGQKAMLRAVEELKEQTGGPVTFSMINEYRDQLEKEFTLSVQVGLTLMGVEESDDFRLLATADGEIEILCDDPELKEKIATLLEESEGMKDQFLYIQALGNIQRTQQTLGARSQMMSTKASLGADAMDIFLNSAATQGTGYSSLLGNFSGGSAQYLLGANYTV